MIKITANTTTDEIYDMCEVWANELYDVLMDGVKLGLLGGVDGITEETTLKNVIEGVKVDVDETLSNIVDEFNYKAKKKIEDIYRSVIDEVE